MEEGLKGSPPKRKLSRLNRAKETTTFSPTKPLQPADNRLNSTTGDLTSREEK